MTEHTPTPWRVGPDSTDPLYIAAADKGMTAFVGVVPIPMQTGREEDENRANAAFIVNAANNHDALVTILKVFLGHDKRFQIAIGGNPIALDRMLTDARETLAAVSLHDGKQP